ncbi:MAG: hypothetical protein Q8P50_03875 [Bacillota bacterium]|nr:hypothetical protein [Bacillota bacterium]
MEHDPASWLLEQGGPIVRWRVKTGLAETGLEPVARAALLAEVAGLPEVARWLENLGP